MIGDTEQEDQFIVTAATLSVSGIGLANACQTLSAPALGLGLAGSYLLADLASGILHMTLDNIDVDTAPKPLKRLVEDFQAHHQEPWRMKHDSFWFQNNSLYSFLLCTFSGAVGLQALGYDMPAYLAITTGLWSMMPQIAHAAAHGKYKGNKVISFLQDYGIIISEGHHRGHHKGDFDKNFCILAGYMEPVASRIYSGSKFVINGWKKLWGRKSKNA